MDKLELWLAETLYKIGSVPDKRSSPGGKGFRLKLHEKRPEAPLSPFLINLRTPDNPKPGPVTPEIVMYIGRALYNRAEKLGLQYDHVAGLPNAGDPLARAFMACAPFERRASLLRLKKEGDSKERRITGLLEGAVTPGQTVLLLDDVITEADSKIEAIRVLRDLGLAIKDVLVLVDREQGGARQLADLGCQLSSVYTLHGPRGLIDFGHDYGLLPRDIYDEIMLYLRG